LQQHRNPSPQKTMQITQIQCIKHKENLQQQAMCVLNFQITKNDFKTLDFIPYIKYLELRSHWNLLQVNFPSLPIVTKI